MSNVPGAGMDSSKWSISQSDFLSFDVMDAKKRQNHSIYIRVLRSMTPEQRLRKAFELSDFSRQLFVYGLRKRYPDLPESEFTSLLLKRLDKCHNRNY
jgi:hypothetical protein